MASKREINTNNRDKGRGDRRKEKLEVRKEISFVDEEEQALATKSPYQVVSNGTKTKKGYAIILERKEATGRE